MAKLPAVYNTADLPDTGGALPLIPNGQYPAVIVSSEMVANKKNTGYFLALQIVITQGPYANTEFTERLNLVNQNEQAVQIALKTLARISEAVGMTQTPQDSEQLHNKPFYIETKTEAGGEYTDNDGVVRQGNDKSVIAKYLQQPSVGVAQAPAAAAQPQQGGAARPVAVHQPQPQTMPTNAPPAGGLPKWGQQ